MSGHLEVLHPGIGSTLQDAGRHGYRHLGVPTAGWLDEPLAHAANALLANPLAAAVLELRGVGLQLRADGGPVQIALAGAVDATVKRQDQGQQPLAAWCTATLQPGDVLHLGLARSGCAYLAVAGGFAPEPVLGSRAMEWRAGLTGLLGRPLQTGDRLPVGVLDAASAAADPNGADEVTSTPPALAGEPAAPGLGPEGGTPAGPAPGGATEWHTPEPWTSATGPIRVMAGPQDDHFSPGALALFTSADWLATAAQDRMGLRFDGPQLMHRDKASADIVSDAATPGAIQVPAAGRPIVLMADCQTVGGYPKIGTVIRADLPRLAHLKPGTAVRFAFVDGATARAALAEQRARWQRWAATRQPLRPIGGIDEAALYGCNLISGMVLAEPL